MIYPYISLFIPYILIIFFALIGTDYAMADEAKKHRPMDTQLSEAQGRTLLRIARRTIAESLGMPPPSDDADVLNNAKADQDLQALRGTFVTLTIDGNLRGCIGSLAPTESILEGVRRNAVNAAFNDPRFNLLTRDEFKDITIEVSILSEPKPLHYTDNAELISKLRVNIDGVIIRKGSSSATFLPQVWTQLPHPEVFLEHLCRKAGLSGEAWRSEKLEVFTYQVQYFEEHK